MHYSMLNFQQVRIYIYLKKWNNLGGFNYMGIRRDFELKQKKKKSQTKHQNQTQKTKTNKQKIKSIQT